MDGSRGGSPDFTRGGRRMKDLDEGGAPDAAAAAAEAAPEAAPASLPDRPRVVLLVLEVVVAWSRVRSPARELRKARSLWLKRARPYSSGTGGGGLGNASMRSWPVRGGRRDVDVDKEADAGMIEDERGRWERGWVGEVW